MPLVAMSLPCARLRLREGALESEVKGSIEIFASRHLAARLKRQRSLPLANDQQLWIAGNSCCRMRVSVLMDDEFICGKESVSQLINWIQDCTVWSQLGLRIRFCGGLSSIIASDLTFTIQHPDLSSSIVAPSVAQTADFKLASCCVYLRKNRAPVRRSQRRRKKSNLNYFSEGVKEYESIEPFEGEKEGEFYRDLDTTDREAINNFVLDIGPSGLAQDSQERHSKLIENERLMRILHASLATFVGGSSKTRGVQVLQSGTSLASIAPGVFNMPFLKVVCQRAPLISVVARSLAAMEKAESPSLRRKMAYLKSAFQEGNTVQESESLIKSNFDLIRCIEGKAWELMMSKLKTAKVPQARAKTPLDADKDTDTYCLSPTSSRYIDQFLSSPEEKVEESYPNLDTHEDVARGVENASAYVDLMASAGLDAMYSTDLTESQAPYSDIPSTIYDLHSLSSFPQPSFYLVPANATADMMELTY